MKKNIKEKLNNNINRPLLIASFVCYIILLIWVILFKANIMYIVKDIIKHQLYTPFEGRVCLFFGFYFSPQVILNIIIFIPFGIFFPLLFKKTNYYRDAFLGFAISSLFEVIQIITALGNVEILDLITNTLGVIIGSILFYLLFRKIKYLTTNYICIAFLIVCVPVCLYAIINTAINFNIYLPFFDGTSISFL